VRNSKPENVCFLCGLHQFFFFIHAYIPYLQPFQLSTLAYLSPGNYFVISVLKMSFNRFYLLAMGSIVLHENKAAILIVNISLHVEEGET